MIERKIDNTRDLVIFPPHQGEPVIKLGFAVLWVIGGFVVCLVGAIAYQEMAFSRGRIQAIGVVVVIFTVYLSLGALVLLN